MTRTHARIHACIHREGRTRAGGGVAGEGSSLPPVSTLCSLSNMAEPARAPTRRAAPPSMPVAVAEGGVGGATGTLPPVLCPRWCRRSIKSLMRCSPTSALARPPGVNMSTTETFLGLCRTRMKASHSHTLGDAWGGDRRGGDGGGCRTVGGRGRRTVLHDPLHCGLLPPMGMRPTPLPLHAQRERA
jgi:hypothetical protein